MKDDGLKIITMKLIYFQTTSEYKLNVLRILVGLISKSSLNYYIKVFY